MATIISCSKGSSPTPPPPPPTPTLNVSVSPEPAWNNGTSTISWTATNTDSVQVNGVKVSGNSFVTPSLTASATYTITAFGPGGSFTTTVTVRVWSQNMTLLSNYGNWKIIYSVSYKQADSLNPALYNYFLIDTVNCKTVRYNTNILSYLTSILGFGGQIIEGCSNPTVTQNFIWDWENNETQIQYDIGLFATHWNVDTLNTSLLRISQNRPDSTFPGIIIHYVRKYVHG